MCAAIPAGDQASVETALAANFTMLHSDSSNLVMGLERLNIVTAQRPTGASARAESALTMEHGYVVVVGDAVPIT